MTGEVPFGAHQIDWGFPRPWGGGKEDSRSIRVYYGSHARFIPITPVLTRQDIAWVMIDQKLDPDHYDWSFAIGHEMWLWPVGFSTVPYSNRLTKTLIKNHVHRVVKVQGFSMETIEAIRKGDMLVANAGRAEIKHRHKYLEAGQ